MLHNAIFIYFPKNSKSSYATLFDKFLVTESRLSCIHGYHASPHVAEKCASGCRHSCTEILRDTLSASWALTDADACTCIAGSIKLWWRSADARMWYPLEVLRLSLYMFLILIKLINSPTSVDRAHLRLPANCRIYAKYPPISKTTHMFPSSSGQSRIVQQ